MKVCAEFEAEYFVSAVAAVTYDDRPSLLGIDLLQSDRPTKLQVYHA